MGHLWHVRPRDFGIDGEIELVDSDSRVASGHQVLVQSKGSDKPFPGETDAAFHFVVEAGHLEGWLQSRIPVILVCSHPSTQEAWFKPISEWFSSPDRLRSRRVSFDKAADRLDTRAAHRLERVAASTHTSSLASPPARQETLRSNLLAVESWPAHIHRAKCATSDPREAWGLLRECCDDPRCDWRLRDGHLESFVALDEGPLSSIVAGPIKRLPAIDWALSADTQVEHAFIELLGLSVQQMFTDDLAWHRERKYLYFRATAELDARRVTGARDGVGVTVFKPYMKKREPLQVGYYRHAALRRRFIKIDGAWFMALLPTYHFTFNGYRESFWASDMLAGIKRKEKNEAVRRWVETWARFLRGADQGPSLLGDDRPVAFGDLLSFEVDHGIDDRAWERPSGSRHGGAELNLFEVA